MIGMLAAPCRRRATHGRELPRPLHWWESHIGFSHEALTASPELITVFTLANLMQLNVAVVVFEIRLVLLDPARSESVDGMSDFCVHTVFMIIFQ